MNRIAAVIAFPLLFGCTTHADERPVISHPSPQQKIGEANDPACPPDDAPCFRIDAEGRVPKGMHPFFAVEPTEASPRMWIQPRIHAMADDGSVSGTIYLGEEDNGAKQFFKIYLIACADADSLGRSRTILRVPKGCVASHPVKVYRVR